MSSNPPRELAAAGRALWRRITERYEVDGPHETAVLREACGVADRLAQLREVLADADFTQPAMIRLVAEERQQRAALSLLLLSRLGLPSGVTDDGEPVKRTPRSRRARAAASARWANREPGVSGKAARAAAARWGGRVS